MLFLAFLEGKLSQSFSSGPSTDAVGADDDEEAIARPKGNFPVFLPSLVLLSKILTLPAHTKTQNRIAKLIYMATCGWSLVIITLAIYSYHWFSMHVHVRHTVHITAIYDARYRPGRAHKVALGQQLQLTVSAVHTGSDQSPANYAVRFRSGDHSLDG